MNLITLEFLSRNCKIEEHSSCAAKWFGLGFEVYCCCKCHIELNKWSTLEEAEGLSSNAKVSLERSFNDTSY